MQLHAAMPPLALLMMRCLLIVALCLADGLSAWNFGAMAVTRAQHASTADHDAVAGGEDCEDSASQDGKSASHSDCDCSLSSACCTCAFPVAAMIHAMPFFSAQHLTDQPVTRSVVLAALGDNAHVFRPPIG